MAVSEVESAEDKRTKLEHFRVILTEDYYADKKNKTDKRIQRKSDKQSYSACPSFALKVTSEQIHSFCSDLRKNSTKSKPMILDLLEGNDYKPVIVKDVEIKTARCHVYTDHDYLQGKLKIEHGVEASEPSEVDHPLTFKKQNIYAIHDNECEPFDSNYSSNSHLIISHSVLIASENSEQCDPESQFAADIHVKEMPISRVNTKTTTEAGNVSYVTIPYKDQSSR